MDMGTNRNSNGDGNGNGNDYIPASSPKPSRSKQQQQVQNQYCFISIDTECAPSSESVRLAEGASSPSSLPPPCLSLLQKFYDELMIPAFPLEEERDDINDWLECFRKQIEFRRHRIRRRQQRDVKDVLTNRLKKEGVTTLVQQLENNDDNKEAGENDFVGPAMDVILMIMAQRRAEEEGAPCQNKNKCAIIGGAAVEFYGQSRVGLLSYIVLHDDFRGRGLAKYLHEEALARLETLARFYGSASEQEQAMSTLASDMLLSNPADAELPLARRQTPLRAIFAETNTAAAGDVTLEQSLQRHKFLFHLGYRLVKFPYAQPPLSPNDINATFDDIVLLVYFPSNNICERLCPWFLEDNSNNSNTAQINVSLIFRYIEDFYQSVFGYGLEGEKESGNLESCIEGIPDYRTADYYRFAHWFTHHHRMDSKCVDVCLCSPAPWQDCKKSLISDWKEWQEEQQNSNS